MRIIINAALLISLAFVGHAQQICRTGIVPSTPDSRFVDNGDGTISDSDTGLMWQKCSLGLSGNRCNNGSATTHNWQQALEAAQNNALAEYSDWRLPNIKELSSIAEQKCHNPAINSNYFPNTQSTYYWSASPESNGSSTAWNVHFYFGYAHNHYRRTDLYVRLVRSEPPQKHVTKRSDR